MKTNAILKEDTMLDTHEVNEIKNFLIETMIRGYANPSQDWFAWCVRSRYLQTAKEYNLFTTSDSEWRWVLSDKGRAWLNEQRS